MIAPALAVDLPVHAEKRSTADEHQSICARLDEAASEAEDGAERTHRLTDELCRPRK